MCNSFGPVTQFILLMAQVVASVALLIQGARVCQAEEGRGRGAGREVVKG